MRRKRITVMVFVTALCAGGISFLLAKYVLCVYPAIEFISPKISDAESRLTDEIIALLEQEAKSDKWPGACLPRITTVLRDKTTGQIVRYGRNKSIQLLMAPPCGETLCTVEEGKQIPESYSRPVIVACADQPSCEKRLCFLFYRLSGTFLVRRRFLRDDEISWYYQVPMEFLDEDEKGRERDYRKTNSVTFPRTFHVE